MTNVNCRWKERSLMSVSYNKLWKMLIDQKMSHMVWLMNHIEMPYVSQTR